MDNITLLPISAHVAKIIVEQFQYGDIVSMDDLFKLLEVETPPGRITSAEYQRLSFKRMNLIDDLKNRLLEEHSIFLKNKRSEGYVLVLPEEQSAVVLDHMDSKIKKHLHKAAAGVTNIRMDMLSDQQRDENIRARTRVSGIATMLQRERKVFASGVKRIEKD